MRGTLENNKAQDVWFKTFKGGDLLSLAISGAFTVPASPMNGAPPFIIKLDPTGAQNVTCPTKGSRFCFLLIHASTNAVSLTVKDSTGTTIGTVAQNKMAIVVDDGVATFCGVMGQS